MHYIRLARFLAIAAILTIFVPVFTSPAGAHAGGPSLHLSRSNAAPADKVQVTGVGFAPASNAIISANFVVDGKQWPVRVATPVSGAGTLSAFLTVPAKTAPGQYQVTVQDTKGNKTSTTLAVLPVVTLSVGASHAPTVTVVAAHGFYLNASGFSAGEQVTVSAPIPMYNGNTVTLSKTATADANGIVHELLLIVPNGAKQGSVQLTATGSTSKKQATATVSTVYRPSVHLSPSPGRPGSKVTVTGNGFVPNSQVTISIPMTRSDGTHVTLSRTIGADEHGQVSASFDLPSNVKTGSYTVTATDEKDIHASRSLSITISPAISVSPQKPAPGGSVTVTGSGFTANARIHLTAQVPLYGGGTRAIDLTVTTNGQGSFTAKVSVPGHAAVSSFQILATGPNGHARASITVQSLATRITVNPTALRPGSRVTVKGSGYPSGDTVNVSMRITLTDGSTQVLTAKATASSGGSFIAALALPGNTRVGTYSVTAVSSATGRSPQAQVHVAVSAHIAVQPTSVQPGHSITVTGGGFSANASVSITVSVPLYTGGTRTVATTVHTDSSGNFSTKLSVPSKASAGNLQVTAQGPNARTAARVQIGHVNATIAVSPLAAIPGASVQVTGSGYPAGDTITLRTSVTTSSGTQPLTKTVKANAQGHFTATFQIPANATAGTYGVTATSGASGRAPKAQLKIVTVPTSLVAAPTTAAPGTAVTVNGFGFAAGEKVTVSLNGQSVGTATANGSGQFSAKITVPGATASGSFTLSAAGSAGHNAKAALTVNRQVSTHFYFASLYTGKNRSVSIAMLNPSETRARVQITYQLKGGGTKTKTVDIAPHTRATENVNADLGPNVSASASIAADVGIAAERLMYVRSSGSVVPGARNPSGRWYFANGNTIGKYRVYLALQNPNNASVQVSVRYMPTHSNPFTVVRTMAPNSRMTLKANKFVKKDAFGTLVTSSMPVVANQTIFVMHGMTSKLGINQPQNRWYFAAGPRDSKARNWIAVINPTGQTESLTLHAYGPTGQELGTVHDTLRPGDRAGYLMNRVAHRTDVSVVITSTGPTVAEQTTYIGKHHDASTDSMGITPAKAWGFAAVNTVSGSSDGLDLFNPSLTPVPIVVQFMTASGSVVQRTYVVSPLAHQHVDVTSVVPNAYLGLTATSTSPFVAMNRLFFNNKAGSTTSHGVQM